MPALSVAQPNLVVVPFNTSNLEVLQRPIEFAQYASVAYREALSRYGLIGSMSAVGNPYGNAQAQSFMKTLKVEEVYLAGYETFTDVTSRLPMFLEDVYNAKRMHSSLGYLSPNRFEDRCAQQAA
jgi:putative transposase